jgi:starch synthase
MAGVPEPLRLCLVASELAPFAKSGGLGDVCAALGRALYDAGHDVRPFLPLYSQVETDGHDFVPVEFLTDVPLELGPHSLRFTVYTAPLPGSGLPLYFVHCPALYHRQRLYGESDDGLRFAFLCRAALESCQRMGWGPDVFHLNDWHTGLLPVYLRAIYGWDELFAHSKTLLTIHNVGYQGIFDADLLGQIGLGDAASYFHQEHLAEGHVGLLETGILHAGVLTTVSRTHAEEIKSEQYASGLAPLLRARADHLVGIVNGIDTEVWDPATDPLIPHHYSASDMAGKEQNKLHLLDGMGLPAQAEVPLVGIVSRLAPQKGFELVFQALPRLFGERRFRLVVLGSGEASYEERFTRMARSLPGRIAFYRGYNERLAHLIEAGADLFLMPSRYEPCGLNQMYSQRYGTVPVVRKTGGLADTVEPYHPGAGTGTGFVFNHFTAEGLRWALDRALDTYDNRTTWAGLVERGMARDFSWATQADKYVALYRALVEGRL